VNVIDRKVCVAVSYGFVVSDMLIIHKRKPHSRVVSHAVHLAHMGDQLFAGHLIGWLCCLHLRYPFAVFV
jgi:hypothetical protein